MFVRLIQLMIVTGMVFVHTIFCLGQQIIEIDGVVIDRNDKPVTNASVYLWHEPQLATPDQLIEGVSALKDGTFGRTIEWKEGFEVRILISVAPIPGCFLPVSVFSGKFMNRQIIVPKYLPRISLGRYSDYVRYGKVSVDLSEMDTSFIETSRKHGIKARIKNQNGELIFDDMIPLENGPNLKQAAFCLPNGQWQIDIFDSKEQKLRTTGDCNRFDIDSDVDSLITILR